VPESDPITIGPIGRLIRWIKESSSWITRIFTALLIVYLSVRAGLSYLDHPATWEEYSDRAFIFAGFMILLVGSIIREASRIRKERYANTFDKLHAIGSKVKDLNTFLLRQSTGHTVGLGDLRRAVRVDLEKILDNLSDIFSMITGTVCRTAVKVIFEENNTVYVYTLVRDSRSTENNSRSDKERLESRQDKLEGNEDFFSIFEEKIDYFVDNNLPARRDYKNTSFLVYGPRPPGTTFMSQWFTSIGWTLPYRSAMVFPIRQLEPTTGGEEELGCIGFLSVDSAFRKVFERRFDGPLGATVASALFHPLSVYVKLIAEAEQKG
jgi:hypothetical protein